MLLVMVMDFPKRKPLRLNGYDYSQDGYYFITICTKDKQKLLCDIVGEGLCALPTIRLTPIGKKVDNAIVFINNQYENVSVDKYVIMPNHVHLILEIKAGGDGTPTLRVYDVIGRLKSFSDKHYEGTLWQRSFYDHIIRGEMDYLEIWNYIDENPAKWKEDRFFTE